MNEQINKFIDIISAELDINSWQTAKAIDLLEGGATIPFIARYRKEYTGSLDEVSLQFIRDSLARLKELERRRGAILESISEQGKLTDELKEKICSAKTLSELEDLYLPYRPKRKTRATIAIAKGLEPFAKDIFSQKEMNLELEAKKYISEENDLDNIDEVLAGARDIIAEWVNENASARHSIRRLFEKEALIKSHIIKNKKSEGSKYQAYFDWEEKITGAPSHRILAMFRGENEKFLRISILPSEAKALDILEQFFVKGTTESSNQVAKAVKDSYKRLIAPSIENEMRQVLKQKADEKAISVFADNLAQLLLAPPLGEQNILAIDPGFKTGCKVVCLDKQGRLMHNETIYPHPPQREWRQAQKKIQSLADAYDIEAIAIGNGTASRETENLIRSIQFKNDVKAVMVNESGASVYSASKLAREEFPNYDVTVRGTVSIGRRLADPLAELVKIDPKSIGVGQYQHDVDQKALQQKLDDVVISCVNGVGVEVNTASAQLLKYVSGLGPTLAKKIIEYRNSHGPFKSREELKKVPRFGDKAFELAAGFLRINQSENPLDRSAVHPESYPVVELMAKDQDTTVQNLVNNEKLLNKIDINKYVTKQTGLPTLKDIIEELIKPGRDPRKKFASFEFDKNINSINDLKIGMVLPGIVTNITAFGAFVDVGVHQDGLVHISEMAERFVSNPAEIVKLNQPVTVKILNVDVDRKRINMSMKV